SISIHNSSPQRSPSLLSSDLFQRYFTTLDQICQTCQIPICVHAVKWIIAFQIVKQVIFYLCPLSHEARVVLFDYFYLGNMGHGFLVATTYLFINPYILVNQMYVGATPTDYIQVPAQILMFNRAKRYFLSSSFGEAERIGTLMKKRMVAFANYYVTFVIFVC